MKSFIGLVLFTIFQNCFHRCENFKTHESSIPVVCEKKHFVEHYVNNNSWLSLEKLKEYKDVCSNATSSCGSGMIYIMYAEEEKVKKYWWFFDVAELYKGKENCWGMFMGIESSDELIDMRYLNFNPNEQFINESRMYARTEVGMKYRFSLYSVPFGEQPLTVVMKAPTHCENGVLDEFYVKLKEHEACESSIDFHARLELATHVCSLYSKNSTERMNYMKHRVIITKECHLQIEERNITESNGSERKTLENANRHTKDNKLNITNFILGGVTGFLVISVIIMIFVLKKCKKHDTKRLTQISISSSHLEGIERCAYYCVKDSEEKNPLSNQR